MKKKGIAAGMMMGLSLLVMSIAVSGEEAPVTEIGGIAGSSASEGDMKENETLTIDQVADITYLGYTADNYAMSIAAYARDDEETIVTPRMESPNQAAERTINSNNGYVWPSQARHKFYLDNPGDKHGYYYMYVDTGAALIPSSEDYMLVDVRMNILNRSQEPLSLSEVKATLTYLDDYQFNLTAIREETTDGADHPNEWLKDVEDLPMLVNRNEHFLFEVPTIVATDTTGSLVASFDFFGETRDIELR